jgi:cytochrome c553
MKKALRLPLALAGLLSITFLAAPARAQDVKPGDPAAAHKKVAMCIGCHGIPGYQSSFPEIHRVPMISGQSAKYIVTALQAYQKGDRKHPTMKGIAASLSEQDMADIAAYYEADGKGLPPTPAKVSTTSAEIDALLKRGNCISCHGENLNKPIDASYPKLAGQHKDYLYVAMKSYQIDKNPQIGRNNAIMATQAKMFTHAELKQLSNYIGSLSGDLKTVPQARFKAQ